MNALANGKTTQAMTILEHLENRGPISPGEALLVYGVYRLAARICELRDLGYDIETMMCTDANGKRYARYSL